MEAKSQGRGTEDSNGDGEMTWGEFKKRVESTGVLDTDIVSFIDIQQPKELLGLEVTRKQLRGAKTLMGVEISNYD